MGLLKAGIGALGGALADSWREYFYCESLSSDVLMTKGTKRTGGRSSNTRGTENIISNGSVIAVADGQCMIIVEQGKVVEVCAEPGEFVYDTSTEPSIFYGKLNGEKIKQSFASVGKRFTFGGEPGKDQRVYYFNTKEIIDNKFGTPSPIIFEVMNKRIGFSRTVQVRCNGVYSYKITNPLLFYTEISGNVGSEYTRDMLDNQLKSEFVSVLQDGFAVLAELELRPAQIPAHTSELTQALDKALQVKWTEKRGISLGSVAISPITLTEEDMKKINQLEDAASLGQNPFMMAGRMVDSTATAKETAAGNPNGAMMGFMGMGMASAAGGGDFAAAQSFYNQGMQQQQMQQQMQQQQMQQPQAAPGAQQGGWSCSCGNTNTGKFCVNCGSPKPVEQEGWSCSCGTVNKGKFCMNCGTPKPAGAPLYQCDKCGWKPEDPQKPPKFCPECGDIFDSNDAQ